LLQRTLDPSPEAAEPQLPWSITHGLDRLAQVERKARHVATASTEMAHAQAAINSAPIK